jgi:hypothetical protein
MSVGAALAAVCVLIGSAAAAADAPANPTLDELLSLLAARRHGHVTFTEVHEMAMLKEPLQSSGELLYDAPDRLEKRTLKPRPEVLLLEHGVLTMQRGHRQHVVTLADTPQLVPFVEASAPRSPGTGRRSSTTSRWAATGTSRTGLCTSSRRRQASRAACKKCASAAHAMRSGR